MLRHLVCLGAGTAVAATLFPLTTFAQTSSGGIPTREELERAAPAEPATPAQSRITNQAEIERAPCPLASPEFADATFTLSAVDFGDLKSISPALLSPAYDRFIGQTLNVGAICQIRDEAATILRRAGYLAAVQVPPQRIEGGLVKLDLLVAKIVDFRVRGNAGKSEAVIAGYLEAIRAQPVFNLNDAERYLLLARDIPGYDVKMTLRPAGTVAGEVIGEVEVLYSPFELNLNVQNYGSRDVGRVGGLLQARFNGVLGIGDRTTIGYFATSDFKEQHVLQVGEEIRLGREGLTLAGDFTYAWTRPSLGPQLDLRSETLVASLELRYPLVRRQTRNVGLSAGFDFLNQSARFAGAPLSRDRLRVGYARISGDAFDADSLSSVEGYSIVEPKWRFGGSVELRHGIDVFGASDDCGPTFNACSAPGFVPISRIEGKPTAFVARASAVAEYRPIPQITFSIAPRLQYSPSALLSYEEFSAGNFTVGRGYDPGALIGDSGIAVATELRFGSIVPPSRTLIAAQPYVFLDAAWVWNKDSVFDGIDPQRLYSVGGGVRFAQGDSVNFDIGVSVPLRAAGLQDAVRPPARLLATLAVRILPRRR